MEHQLQEGQKRRKLVRKGSIAGGHAGKTESKNHGWSDVENERLCCEPACTEERPAEPDSELCGR